jgi:hypothetical protein
MTASVIFWKLTNEVTPPFFSLLAILPAFLPSCLLPAFLRSSPSFPAELPLFFFSDGAVIVHNMLSHDVVMTLLNDLDSTLNSVDAGTKAAHPMIKSFWGSNTKRFTRLAWRSRSFAKNVLVHPLFLRMADNILLDSNTASYWMVGHLLLCPLPITSLFTRSRPHVSQNTGQMMVVGPGSVEQVAFKIMWFCS